MNEPATDVAETVPDLDQPVPRPVLAQELLPYLAAEGRPYFDAAVAAFQRDKALEQAELLNQVRLQQAVELDDLRARVAALTPDDVADLVEPSPG